MKMKRKMWKKESWWTIKINAEKMKMWKNRVGGSKEKSLEHQRHDYIEAYCEAMHPWNVTLFRTTYFKGISKCEPNNDKNDKYWWKWSQQGNENVSSWKIIQMIEMVAGQKNSISQICIKWLCIIFYNNTWVK